MKNCGISILDITDKDGALRLSVFGIWSENSTYFEHGRSLLAIEKSQQEITIDLCFMRFSVDLCQ